MLKSLFLSDTLPRVFRADLTTASQDATFFIIFFFSEIKQNLNDGSRSARIGSFLVFGA